MGISRSGLYAYRKNEPKRILRDNKDLKIITTYFKDSREKAGILTLDMLLRRDGIKINNKKIARIKKEYGLFTRIRRRNPYRDIPLKSQENQHVPNLLNRDFYPLHPDEVYSTDMTYLFYGKCEKAFLSATKDLGTNEIVSFKLMKTPTVTAFVNEFKQLLYNLPKRRREGLMVHSDQGFQYTHPSFRDLLREAGVTQSMSRRGNCLDNAPIESFFGHFKDLIETKHCKSFEEVEDRVKETINYYNNERPQRALSKKPPAEYRGLISGLF